jgi:hypothetical protein
MLPYVSEALQKRIRECGAGLRIGFPWWMAPFLRGYLGITLGRTIYLAPAVLQRGPGALEATLRHELAHLRQQMRLGLVRFLYHYLAEYVRLRLARMTHQQAYHAISFEREAREEEGVLV